MFDLFDEDIELEEGKIDIETPNGMTFTKGGENKALVQGMGKGGEIEISNNHFKNFFEDEELDSLLDEEDGDIYNEDEELEALMDEALGLTAMNSSVEYGTKTALAESSLLLNSNMLSEAIELDEGKLGDFAIGKILPFFTRNFAIGQDAKENERQFKKVYTELKATNSLKPEAYKANASKLLNACGRSIVLGAKLGIAMYLNFIPVLGQIAFVYVMNKLNAKEAEAQLKSNAKVLKSMEKSLEAQLKNKKNTSEQNKAYKDALARVKKVRETTEAKAEMYAKANSKKSKVKNEDVEFDEETKLQEELFNITEGDDIDCDDCDTDEMNEEDEEVLSEDEELDKLFDF